MLWFVVGVAVVATIFVVGIMRTYNEPLSGASQGGGQLEPERVEKDAEA